MRPTQYVATLVQNALFNPEYLPESKLQFLSLAAFGGMIFASYYSYLDDKKENLLAIFSNQEAFI